MKRVQHLYFITDARRTSVKIGIATDPERRLKDLQAGNHTRLRLELVLNFELPGDAGRYEGALHEQFAEHWRHKEWFTYAAPIKEYVATWQRGETPLIIWPETSWKRAVNEYGVGLTKDEYLAILRKKARGR